MPVTYRDDWKLGTNTKSPIFFHIPRTGETDWADVVSYNIKQLSAAFPTNWDPSKFARLIEGWYVDDLHKHKYADEAGALKPGFKLTNGDTKEEIITGKTDAQGRMAVHSLKDWFASSIHYHDLDTALDWAGFKTGAALNRNYHKRIAYGAGSPPANPYPNSRTATGPQTGDVWIEI